MKIKNIFILLIIILSINNVSSEIVDHDIYTDSISPQYCTANDIIMIDDNKVLVGYGDSGYNLQLKLGEINNENITWGIPYHVEHMGGSVKPISLLKIDNNKVIICYGVHGALPPTIECKICTINNDVLTFSSVYSFTSVVEYIDLVLLSTSKFALIYNDFTDGFATIGTISGNVINYGSHYNFDVDPQFISANRINDNCFIINSNQGSIIGNELNTVISFGLNYPINNNMLGGLSSDMIDNNNCLLNYLSSSHSNHLISRIATINNNIVTFGNEYTYDATVVNDCSMAIINETAFNIIYKNDKNINYINGSISNADINYNTYETIYTDLYSVQCNNVINLNQYSFVTIFITWGASGINGHSMLWDSTPPPPFVHNITATHYTETFDNLYENIDAWAVLVIIFTMFEDNCGGNLFWIFIIVLPFTMIWIKQGSVIIPSILALVCGSSLFVLLPIEAIAPIKVLLTVGIAGIFYHIIKSR